MRPVILLNCGWMERYDGPADIFGGGSFIQENGVGWEILAIFTATHPQYGGLYVVGWYHDAILYREYQEIELPGRIINDLGCGILC